MNTKNCTTKLVKEDTQRQAVYSTPRQTALIAVTDVIKESVLFTVVCCFFAIGIVKFLQLSFLFFFGEELTAFEFVRGNMNKT